MSKTRMFPGIILLITLLVLVLALSMSSFYSYWNSASPDKTCASCHEIGMSVLSSAQSSHREMHCKECHGTAFSNGFHSMKEKGQMLLNHFRKRIPREIRLNENQLLAVMSSCKRCHANEFADWKSGGHSVNYASIFLDTLHNKTEQLNSDCLRCHGMFFGGTTADLVEPLNKIGPWTLSDKKKASQAAIPCMACHEIHSDGEPSVSPNYSNPSGVFYSRKISSSFLSFYDRHEKTHVPVDLLPQLKMYDGEKLIRISDDIVTRNCVQCHAPDSFHRPGSGDDRTPRGVHEGLSCVSCHELHSNNAKNNCVNCHPAISNCKLDVTTMNTTYADPRSPNNIHWVSCTDCHKNDPKFSRKR